MQTSWIGAGDAGMHLDLGTSDSQHFRMPRAFSEAVWSAIQRNPFLSVRRLVGRTGMVVFTTIFPGTPCNKPEKRWGRRKKIREWSTERTSWGGMERQKWRWPEKLATDANFGRGSDPMLFETNQYHARLLSVPRDWNVNRTEKKANALF